MEYSLLEVIGFLSNIENKDCQFKRVNDKYLRIKRGFYGDLISSLDLWEHSQIFRLFNYMNGEKFILVENERGVI